MQGILRGTSAHVLAWANHGHASASSARGGTADSSTRSSLHTCLAAWVALGALHSADAAVAETTAANMLRHLAETVVRTVGVDDTTM